MSRKKLTPARTIEGIENQLVSAAVDLAWKKLTDGTASSQLICLLLNLATSKNQLEMEKIRSDLRLSKAKVDQIEGQKKLEESYKEAVDAMKLYSGNSEEDYDGYEIWE